MKLRETIVVSLCLLTFTEFNTPFGHIQAAQHSLTSSSRDYICQSFRSLNHLIPPISADFSAFRSFLVPQVKRRWIINIKEKEMDLSK